MKLKSILFLVTLIACSGLLLESCNKCDETGTLTFGSDKQSFSVRYLVDSSGANYTSIYRPSQVIVLFDDEGGRGQFSPITENLNDGLIGPFTYTVGAPDVATKGIMHDYVYIVTKDTFGVDTFRIKFYPKVDECQEYFSVLEYYKNGVLLDQLSGQEAPVLEIRE